MGDWVFVPPLYYKNFARNMAAYLGKKSKRSKKGWIASLEKVRQPNLTYIRMWDDVDRTL